MPTYKPYDVFDPQRMNTPSDMQTYIDRLPYFNKTVKITLPFTFTEVKHFLSFLKSIDCDEQTIQNKKISLPELREKIRDYCLDFFVYIQDVSWDDFSWEHIRHLQYDLDEYNVVTGFDDEQQQMMYLSNFKTDIEVSVELFSMIDQIQQAFKSPGKDIVDFDMTGGGAVHSHRVQEEGNRAERDIFSRAPYETIHSDKSLSPYEKFRRMYTYTIWWMRKKQQQGEIFSAKVHYYVCEMINLTTDQWKALSVSHQVAIISLVFSSLLLTTKTPHENSLPADYLDKNITDIPQETKEEIAQIVKKNLEKSGAQEHQTTHGDQTEKVKDQVKKTLTTTTPTPQKPAKDVKDVQKHETEDEKKSKKESSVTKHTGEITPLDPRPFTVVPTSPKEQVHFTATTPLLEVDFDGVQLLKDLKSEVYYIRFRKGQTLLGIHNTLKKYAQFAHLHKKNYRLLWNIDPKKISDGQIIPVPVDNQETILTHKELKKIAGEAIDALKKNPTYGEFMKNLEKTHKKKNLVRLMCLIAEKESNLGATAMYRHESHINKDSYSIYHILYAGPGKKALDTLGFTTGEVIEDPQKAGMWLLAFLYEKSHETGSPKPYSFFKLNNLKAFGTRYNGATRYGADLDAKNREIR